MDLVIPHRVVYDFDGEATVSEVARSIVAQDKLVRDALAILEEVFPRLEFQNPIVSIKEITQASPLRTTLTMAVVAVYSAELGEDVPDILDTLFGIDVPESYDSIVSVLVLLIAIYGVDWLRQKIATKMSEFRNLRAERARLLKEAADRAAITEDHLEEAIERVLGRRKRSVMKASADFFEPAKRLKARSVGSSGANVNKQAIDEMPTDIELAQYEPPTEIEEMQNVTIKFRAHDLDKNKAWAATIEEISPTRRPLHLAPDVRPDQLFDKKQIKGDVLVTSVLDQDGEYAPSLYYLQKVYDDDA